MMMSDKRKKTKGFASMDPARRRELASKGGHTVHALGKAHHYTHEEAVAAGKKSGESRRAKLALKQVGASGPFGDPAVVGSE